MSHITTLMALVAVLACMAPLAELGAQNSVAPPTATVTLVAKADLPRGAKVIVERRPIMNPRNVILVDLDRATAADLAAAVQILAGLHHPADDDPKATVRAAPRSYTPPPGFDKSHYGKQMKAGLVQLLIAPEVTVAGIGRARAVDIQVSLPQGRVRAGQS